MKKTINKALRTKGMKVYLSASCIRYGIDWSQCKRFTKKRIKELSKSIKFINNTRAVSIDHRENYCVIYVNHAKG